MRNMLKVGVLVSCASGVGVQTVLKQTFPLTVLERAPSFQLCQFVLKHIRVLLYICIWRVWELERERVLSVWSFSLIRVPPLAAFERRARGESVNNCAHNFCFSVVFAYLCSTLCRVCVWTLHRRAKKTTPAVCWKALSPSYSGTGRRRQYNPGYDGTGYCGKKSRCAAATFSHGNWARRQRKGERESHIADASASIGSQSSPLPSSPPSSRW